ncbi:MAG: phosphomannomutase/phosphoglucomutase, partial [Myxococcota bacterium]|nr:phosphomannomutase/phosphoglucomutase [Myxococcota bacterium]
TVEENLADLKTHVRQEQADLGIAFDGDADRIGVVDAQGEVIWGDKLMILLSRALLKEEPGATILGEVKCSKALYDDISAHGGRAIMWKTGHSLIKAKMKEENAALAGEMSGHIFFKHRYYGFDDAVYAGGRLLEILSETKQSLAEHLSDVPQLLATPEIRRDCPDEIKFQLVDKIIEDFNNATPDPNINVINTDGLRLEWPDGWGLVRCSNTQPILVLRFEAQTQERLEAIEQFFEEKINAAQSQLSS